MAAKHASVKLSTEFLDDARREAEAFKRSVAAQVEHWARIGRAVENTPGVTAHRVRDALSGRAKFEHLTTVEQTAFLEELGGEWDADTEAAYAALGEQEGAVGRDETGRLVRREADGRLRPLG
jgi:hypothetical protein